MFAFHKPKMFRSSDGCCICGAKSSSSRFTDSSRYETHFKNCFGLCELRFGDICNACVLLIKRWKKLPAGSNKNWNHVVDAKAGASVKTSVKTRRRSSQIHRIQQETKPNSDARSSSSGLSPCYSPSDEGSDSELPPDAVGVSFLDLSYWKRQKVCCGEVYRGRFGEVIICPQLYKPCCFREQANANDSNEANVANANGSPEITETNRCHQEEESR